MKKLKIQWTDGTPNLHDDDGPVDLRDPELLLRIVSCVNGCERIEDPATTVPDLIDRLRNLVSANGGSWERGTAYISRAFADEINRALMDSRLLLADKIRKDGGA